MNNILNPNMGKPYPTLQKVKKETAKDYKAFTEILEKKRQAIEFSVVFD